MTFVSAKERVVFEGKAGKVCSANGGEYVVGNVIDLCFEMVAALSAERAAREAAEAKLAEVRRERDEAVESAAVLDEQFKALAAKMKELHDLMDAYKICEPDGTHPMAIGRLKMALKRMDAAELKNAAAEQRIERLREAIRALLALHVTNGPLEVIEYGPGGTTDEEVAHRKIIDAIHQAALTESEATNGPS